MCNAYFYGSFVDGNYYAKLSAFLEKKAILKFILLKEVQGRQ